MTVIQLFPGYGKFFIFKIQFLSFFLKSSANGRFALFQNGVEYDDDFELNDSEDTGMYFDNWSMETHESFKSLNDKNIITYKIQSSYISTSMLEILLFNAGYDINPDSDVDNSYTDVHNLVSSLNSERAYHIDTGLEKGSSPDRIGRRKRSYIEEKTDDWQEAYDYDMELMNEFGHTFKGWQNNWETLDYSDEMNEDFIGMADVGSPVENADDITTIVEDISNHGCWGSTHNPETQLRGKRGHPVSEVDFLSRYFSKCRHCNMIHGPCATQELSSHIFLKWNGQEYICPVGLNSCDYEICTCSLDWAINVKAIIDESGGVPDKENKTETKVCPVRLNFVASTPKPNASSFTNSSSTKDETFAGSLRSIQICLTGNTKR